MSPELKQFEIDGEARIRDDVDGLNRALATERKAGADLSEASFDGLFTRVLEACVFTGRGALDYDGCLKALAPFKARFASDTLARWAPLVERVAQRSDINKGLIHEHLIGPALGLIRTETDDAESHQGSSSSDSTPSSHHHDGQAPEITDVSNVEEFSALASSWAAVRSSYPTDHRAEWDFALLLAASVRRFRLDPNYAECVVDDDEIWSSARGTEFTESLVEPINANAVGRVAAALLNSRVRSARPRLFLQFPESLVIQAIADPGNDTAFEETIVEEIAYPLVRSLRLLATERNRPGGRAPRRTMLADLEDYLEQVLSRLGLRRDNLDNGSSLAFDPVDHQPVDHVDLGAEVRVIHAGLVDEKSGRRVFKALVEAVVDEPSSGPAEVDESVEGSEPIG